MKKSIKDRSVIIVFFIAVFFKKITAKDVKNQLKNTIALTVCILYALCG